MDGINGIAGGKVTNATQEQGATSKAMGKDDFLKMLIAQLKNQDPTNPQQGTEFAAQLAQYSSLEQLFNLNAALKSQNENTTNMINAQVVSLIGKEITAQIAVGAEGTEQDVVTGQVTAVNFKDEAVSLTVDGRDISFTDVVAVKGGDGS